MGNADGRRRMSNAVGGRDRSIADGRRRVSVIQQAGCSSRSGYPSAKNLSKPVLRCSSGRKCPRTYQKFHDEASRVLNICSDFAKLRLATVNAVRTLRCFIVQQTSGQWAVDDGHYRVHSGQMSSSKVGPGLQAIFIFNSTPISTLNVNKAGQIVTICEVSVNYTTTTRTTTTAATAEARARATATILLLLISQ